MLRPVFLSQTLDCRKMLALTFLYFLVFYLTGNSTLLAVVAPLSHQPSRFACLLKMACEVLPNRHGPGVRCFLGL
jgi:hypothetical protein